MVRKGIIVAAGYGTRFLPITRVVPKELLPLVDRPCLDHVVQELVEAGVTSLLVITSRRKRSIEDWFDWDKELEGVFTAEGADAKRAKLTPPAVDVTFVRQQRMGGTGDALLLARDFAGDEPAIVAFPDDLFGPPNASAALIATWERTGSAVLAAADLGTADVSRYGVLAVEAGDPPRVTRIVEKPPAGTEPSKLVSLGRYLYTPALFAALAEHRRDHAGGEYFPQAAINAVAAAGGVHACVLASPRYDTGAPLGYLQASIEEALSRPELGPALRSWLAERLG